MARHSILCEHMTRIFGGDGIVAVGAAGVDDAIGLAHVTPPNVVVCEYDMLATIPLTLWEHDPVLSSVPMIAVSLTRHPQEMHPLDVNGIAGFFYLPALSSGDVRELLFAAAARPSYSPGRTPGRPALTRTWPDAATPE